MSNSSMGLCHQVMSYKVTGPGYSLDLFGLCNSICLVIACGYLLAAMQSEYIKQYETNDGPLQRLLLGFDTHDEEKDDNNYNTSGRPRKTNTTAPRPHNHNHNHNHNSTNSTTSFPHSSINSSTSSSSSASGVVLPAYYVLCMSSCFTFLLQATAWVVPQYTVASEIAISCVFAACLFNDFVLLIHLIRPIGASARQSACMSCVPAMAVLLYVLFVLPGRVAPETCHFCCVHFPKPGIEVPWLIAGTVALWFSLCAECRMPIVPNVCGRACGCDTSDCVPRRSLAAWAALISIPYLISSVGIFVLDYRLGKHEQEVHSGSTEDLAYCSLIISDLIYSLGYAPIFLYTVTRDSDDCRVIRMRRALQNALGGDSDGAPNLGAEQNTEAVVDIVTDPRLNLIDPNEFSSLRRIGGGGFGDVYKATWHSLPVAVKKLKGIDTNCGATLRELANEAGMLAELRHPNVVLFLGVVMTNDYVGLVTEFMAGGSVRDLLDKKVVVPTRTSTPITLTHQTRVLVMRDTARGMVHLHAGLSVGTGNNNGNNGVGLNMGNGKGGQGRRAGPVIHRDMKTQNLLVDDLVYPRIIKVCDFGLSTSKDRVRTLTAVGTPQYAAPEVLRSDQYSEKADIYSFGVIVWELFQPNGKYPFEDMHALRAAHEVAYSGLRPQPDVPAETPMWVKKLIGSCWASDPQKRPEFKAMLAIIEREASTQ